MKKLTSLLILCLALSFASVAKAQSYGPDFAKFTLTPQEGWTAQAIDSGVQLSNGQTVATIQVVKSEGNAPEALTKGVVQVLKIADAKFSTDEDSCTAEGTLNGKPIFLIITELDKEKALSVAIIGTDRMPVSKMIETIKDVE